MSKVKEQIPQNLREGQISGERANPVSPFEQIPVLDSEAGASTQEKATEGTLFIKKVAIKNFLTYQDFEIGGSSLSPGCNLVLGKNGSGKSSFLKAIIYVLSDRYSHLTKQQKRGLLNNIAQQTSSSQSRPAKQSKQSGAAKGAAKVDEIHTFWVEVTLDNSQHRIPYNAKDLAIRKSYNCDTDREDYQINGNPISQKDLINLFESGNLSLSNLSQYQIVEQGKIQQLVDKGEAGFLEMLKQVTGTAQFDQKIGGMTKSISEAQGKKEQLKQVLDQINEKLEKLKEEIGVFNGYDKAEKDKKAYERCLYFQKIELNQAEIESLRDKKRGLLNEREALLTKREEFLRDESLKGTADVPLGRIERVKGEINALENKILSLQQVREDLMRKQLAELEAFGVMGGQQTNSMLNSGGQRSLLDYYGALGMQTQSFGQQLAEISTNIDNMKMDTSNLEQEKVHLAEQIHEVESKLEELQRDKDGLLLQREVCDNMKSTAQLKKFFQEELRKLQAQKSQAAQDLDDAKREQKGLTSQLSGLSQKVQATSQELQNVQASTREALEQIEKARKTKREVASEVKSQIFKQNELELEINVKQQKQAGFVKQIERVEPTFGALQRIEQKCKEQNIQGYKGLLIDFLVCKSDSYTACVDLAAKSKLCAIIVDTLETAKKVLQINKDIKGGVVNIYPLETLEQMRKPLRPVPSGVKSMLDVVQLSKSADPRLQILMESIFSKVVLLKTYEEGMQVAKDHNLTCITADLEVVYAGAFLTKVGHYNRAKLDKYSIYQQIARIKAEIGQRNEAIKVIKGKRDQNDQQDLEALRGLQKAEAARGQLRQTAQELGAQQMELESQISRKGNNLREIEKSIVLFSKSEATLGTQIKEAEANIKNPQSKASKAQGAQDDSALLKLNRSINEQTLKLKDFQAEHIQLQAKIEQKQQIVNATYLPRQLQLKTLVLEAQQQSSLSGVEGAGGGQSIHDFGIAQDQDYSSHLENEKKAIAEQLTVLNCELQQKQDELNEQVQLSQSQIVGTQTQYQLHEEFEYGHDEGYALHGSQHDLVRQLRVKTQDVEELSMKIDELLQINGTLENHLSKVQRYNQDLFKDTRTKMSGQEMTEGELRNLIAQMNQQLESFPRQNKNCIEYYEKYKMKYDELHSKFTQQQKTEEQISDLLDTLKQKKAKSLEENFKLLSRNFSEIFRNIVQDGSAQLKLVKLASKDLSQQTEQSQFPETGQSQFLSIGESLYTGIKVQVAFSGGSSGQHQDQFQIADDHKQEHLTHSLSHLSGGQKAVVAACLVFAIQQIEAAPFYIMDEFDSALDATYCQGIAEQIQRLSKSHVDPITGETCAGSQFIMTTHKPAMVQLADKILEVTFRAHKSQIKPIDKKKAMEIIDKQSGNK